jgi:NAD(P)H-hydrate epimerase
VTVAQMREVDRSMVEDFGIDLVRMMELAGRHLAEVARWHLPGRDAAGRSVVVLAGGGGNGGGALVAARRLAGWGARVTVLLSTPSARLAGVPAEQLAILERIPVAILDDDPEEDEVADLVLDGLIGYGRNGPPTGRTAELIGWANGQDAPIVSLDVPSGLDPDTGTPDAPTILAEATVTLALPKTGLLAPEARLFVGDLYLADIGVPPELYERQMLALEVGPVFSRHDIVRLT